MAILRQLRIPLAAGRKQSCCLYGRTTWVTDAELPLMLESPL
jgi:hypothetical protein